MTREESIIASPQDLTEAQIKEMFLKERLPRNLANFFLEWECKILSFKEREDLIDSWIEDSDKNYLGATS